ncbi:GntR family transcriptional regulator [Amaricoccus solimangrovi]|uniref:GntR family transcriptional regulator n=1 Tax=Amaricoccus solimangrovi TaxID=2589815 RepID=A0A501WFB0_9RHOB|nr:GntR family transcriptional regulator [Amaricoccus solimangrovi]TPE47492.1 GntR family transcriptional regulator [Amaricoccus solimangrovi]
MEQLKVDSSKSAKPLAQAAVTDRIRQAILENDLAPGQRLIEAELCDLLKVSRGTIRIALMDLAHEGLVERVANRGARVRVVTLEEALQLADVRLAVESLCVALAAERITDAEAATLRALGEDLKRFEAENDVAGFASTTHRIFLTYVAASGQVVAREVLERLRDRNARHRFRLSFRPGRAKVSLPQWLEIIDAICRRDPEAAQAALRRHVDSVKEAMIAVSRDALVLTKHVS